MPRTSRIVFILGFLALVDGVQAGRAEFDAVTERNLVERLVELDGDEKMARTLRLLTAKAPATVEDRKRRKAAMYVARASLQNPSAADKKLAKARAILKGTPLEAALRSKKVARAYLQVFQAGKIAAAAEDAVATFMAQYDQRLIGHHKARACHANLTSLAGAWEMAALTEGGPPGGTLEAALPTLVKNGYLKAEVATCVSGEGKFEAVRDSAGQVESFRCTVHESRLAPGAGGLMSADALREIRTKNAYAWALHRASLEQVGSDGKPRHETLCASNRESAEVELQDRPDLGDPELYRAVAGATPAARPELLRKRLRRRGFQSNEDPSRCPWTDEEYTVVSYPGQHRLYCRVHTGPPPERKNEHPRTSFPVKPRRRVRFPEPLRSQSLAKIRDFFAALGGVVRREPEEVLARLEWNEGGDLQLDVALARVEAVADPLDLGGRVRAGDLEALGTMKNILNLLMAYGPAAEVIEKHGSGMSGAAESIQTFLEAEARQGRGKVDWLLGLSASERQAVCRAELVGALPGPHFRESAPLPEDFGAAAKTLGALRDRPSTTPHGRFLVGRYLYFGAGEASHPDQGLAFLKLARDGGDPGAAHLHGILSAP